MADHTPPTIGPSNSVVISPSDTSLSLAQAIYHHTTTKTERIREVFRDAYTVNESDITNLCHILKQTAQRHHEGEWSCVIDHSIYRKSRTRFSSLERFKVADKSQNSPTGEIVVTYDFLSKNPFAPHGSELKPERYKVVVQVSQEPYLSLLDEDDARPGFITRLSSFPSITISVEYVDYTVARAIIGCAREWVNGLTTTKRSKLAKFLSRNEISIHQLIPSILSGSILIGAGGLIQHSSGNTLPLIFQFFALSVIFYGLGAPIAETFLNNLYVFQAPTTICITKGDKGHQERVGKRRDKARNAIAFVCAAVLLAVCVNIASSYLYDWLKR